MSRRLGKVGSSNIRVKVKSGDILEVRFDANMQEVYLTGPAKIVYRGTVSIA